MMSYNRYRNHFYPNHTTPTASKEIHLELLEASLVLNKAASRQECLAVFRLEANAVQGSKSLLPKGLRLRLLLVALLMPVKPARMHRHASRDCGTQKLDGARNNTHPDLGNSSIYTNPDMKIANSGSILQI